MSGPARNSAGTTMSSVANMSRSFLPLDDLYGRTARPRSPWSQPVSPGGASRTRYSPPMLRLYRIPHSTNVERVALALAHKGLEAESVWVDSADRAPVRKVSKQTLVPVL